MLRSIIVFTICVILGVCSEKEFDDYFLRRDVNHGMAVHIINTGKQCSLIIFNAPQSHGQGQASESAGKDVIGCVPVPENLDTLGYFWLVETSTFKVAYDEEFPKQIPFGSKVWLSSIKSYGNDVSLPFTLLLHQTDAENNPKIWNEGKVVKWLILLYII